MYTQRVTFFTANGKAAELRPILEERVRLRQSQGARAGLQTAVYGAEGPVFILNLQVDDLAALEAIRATPLPADPRIAALTRQPNRIALFEQLLAAQAAATPPKYIQRVGLTPSIGKTGEVAALVVERAKAGQADGIRLTASTQVAGPAAGNVAVGILFGSLAELEKLRARNLTDQAMVQFQAKLSNLIATPARIQVFEVLIPLQAR
jgi:hypothetical protein